ncbi:restriction endonuclease subunit S [Lactococcus petauri]
MKDENLDSEKNKLKEKKGAPELRFKGFLDDWEQRKFAEMYDIVSGFAFKLSDYSDVGVPIVNGEAINHNDISSNNWNYLPESFRNKYPNFLLKTGDIVLGLNRPITNNELKISQVPSILNDSLLYQRAGKVNILNGTDVNFSFHLLNKEIYEFVLKEAVGSDQPFISTTKLKKWQYLVPKSEIEKEKIGAFFYSLNQLITLHQRKLDKLKQLKQGYLQQLFPKNGDIVPELRFEGFAGNWEERKLGEISRMYQPLTITGNDLLPDGVPVFGANGFIGFFSEANHIEDQVTISARGEGTGTPSYVHGPVWITGNSMVVNVDDFDINKYFLFANLTANSLKKYVTGGAQPQITRDVLVKVPITLPNADEQQKIGSFFKQLDDTITLYHRKLDLLKEQKKSYLQNMFI